MDAATIEETNRIRVSLGMKPLPVPGAAAEETNAADSHSDSDGEPASTVETRQAQSYDNYRKVQEAQAAQKKREERKAAIQKARDKAQREARLEGKGLGEADDDDDDDPVDAKAWLTGQKKRQKKIEKARRLEEELAAAEAEAAAALQYTSKDLAGIKVAHDTSAFLDGDEQILTLKDATIGEDDEEGDELENLNLREKEELKDRLSLKKQPGYNPNDDADEDGGILAQYDEEIDGKKRKRFTLNAAGMNAELADILNQPVEKSERSQNVSLDDLVGDAPVSSDYLAPSEIKVKKPKKKKNKGTRQKQLDDDDIFPLDTTPAQDDSAMDIDSKANVPVKKRKAAVDDFGDDDDLQASLAIQRKNALKKRKKTRPEDIAKQLKEQEEEEAREAAAAEDSGLVIGEVSEFVSGLSKPDEDEDNKRARRRTTTKSPGPEHHEDATMEDAHDGGADTAHPEREPSNPPEGTGVDEEKIIGNGLGDTVALLRERGFWKKDEDEDNVHGTQRQREEFLAKKRFLEAELDEQTRLQRERDRASGKLDKMSTREREEWAQSQNKWRDQQQSRRMAELFSQTYKPNVQLKYKDEHGRALDQKEAFKHLSHQFHGKGSGKGKTEKMLKKIGDEKRREAQSMFDASSNGGMSVAAQQQLKKRKEAGVRLG